jgi:hypothetical protein
MKPFVLLRAAAIVAFLYALGHTYGMPWVPDKSPETLAIIQSMTAHHFDAMGVQRSLQDFYVGFGISISIMMFALAVLLWLIAARARVDVASMQPFIVVLLLAFVAKAIIAWMYFFAVPFALSAIIALCLLAAWITARRATN